MSTETATWPKPLDRATVRALIEKAQAGIEARNLIVLHNMALVSAMIKRYGFTSVKQGDCDIEDLESEGALVLIRCVERFDLARNIEFSTYAGRSLQNRFYALYRRFRNHPVVVTDDVYDENLEGQTLLPEEYDQPVEIDGQDTMQLLERLEAAVARLPEREQTILKRRSDKATLRDIANQLGVCKERVRQLEQRVLRRLSEELGGVEEPLSLAR